MMIKEIVYVIKTDIGFKGIKGVMVQSVNRATFYQTYEKAVEQLKCGYLNPRIIKIELKEILE